jgi:alkylation response protein AidB-like acyl-CoA dehydrogenase
MDLQPSEEQQQIIDSTAAFVTNRLPMRRLHAKDGAVDQVAPGLWREIAEMGWLGLGLDEAAGGVGYGLAEEALLFRELGRALAPPRILFTAIAARTASAAGDHALAQRLAGGEITAALAVQDDFGAPATSLARRRLFEARGADVALAVDGDRARLLQIEGGAYEIHESLDRSVSMTVADLSDAKALADVTDPRIGCAGALLTAALQQGLAEEATRMIVEYAKIRQTFGRPIGAYQAVRHPCAEMAARGEEAKAQLFMAAVAAQDGREDAALLVSAARVIAENAAIQNTDDCIQLHGGIGVTEEFDTHLMLKRANTMRTWFGDRRAHLALILDTPVEAA